MDGSFPTVRDKGNKNVPNRLIAVLVGAALGAATRSAMTVLNVYWLWHWGGPWFRGTDAAGDSWLEMGLFLGGVSAFLGLILGGVAGGTRNFRWGALLGAMLSGGIYLGLCIFPTELALAMNSSQQGGNRVWEHGERIQILVGVIPMLAAGAIAGGVGASIGDRGRNKEVNNRLGK